MKSRLFGAYLAACLCLASLYVMGAGTKYPLVWLFLATLFGVASAINFGAFDYRVPELRLAIRLISYTAVLGCVAAILLNRPSELASLPLAGLAAALMFICVMTELPIGGP